MEKPGFRMRPTDEITVATELQQLVQKKEYESIFQLLERIQVKKDAVLGIKECEKNGMGDTSRITITFPDGSVLDHTNDDFWKNITVESSVMGIWQVYLLRNLWTYLPLFWHANYDHHDYIYTKEQMTIINSKPELGDKPIHIDFSRYDISPRIEIKEDRYIVSACYWSDFEGLVREEQAISVNVVGQIVFFERAKTILYPYECGVLY